MKNLERALNHLRFDERLIDWNLQNGIISQSELDTHLNSLQDVHSEAIKIDIDGGV